MRAAPPPASLLRLLLLALLAAPATRARRAEAAAAAPQPDPGLPVPGNATRTGAGAAGGAASNATGDALATRISRLLRGLPTLKAAVVVACAFSALLVACLLLRVFRWVAPPLSRARGPPAAARGARRPGRLGARSPARSRPRRRSALGLVCLTRVLETFCPGNDVCHKPWIPAESANA